MGVFRCSVALLGAGVLTAVIAGSAAASSRTEPKTVVGGGIAAVSGAHRADIRRAVESASPRNLRSDSDDSAIAACAASAPPTPGAHYVYLDRTTNCVLATGYSYRQLCNNGQCRTVSEFLWGIVQVTRTDPTTLAQRVVIHTVPLAEDGDGSAAANAYQIGEHCSSKNGGSCQSDGPDSVTLPAGTWYASHRAVLTYTTTVHAPSSRDRESKTYFDVTPFGGTPGQTGSLPPDEFRCDTAPYIKKNRTRVPGCVFPQKTPVLTYSRSTGNAKAVAEHIHTAQHDPSHTKPGIPGSVIPGAPESGLPLHRILSTDPFRDTQYQANRAIAVGTCLVSDPLYASKKEDCDEYPFASTEEGAAYHEYGGTNSKFSYSAKPIPRSDNRSGGAALKAFYADDRVLAGEAFFVSVD